MYQEIQELIMLKEMHTSHVKPNEQITCEENYCGSEQKVRNQPLSTSESNLKTVDSVVRKA